MDTLSDWKELGLEDPFPSSPKRPPKYVLWIENKKGGMTIQTLCAIYYARILADMVIGDNEFKWLNDKQIETDHGITIKSDDLEAVLEYELKGNQRKYVFPLPFQNSIKATLEGKRPLIVTKQAKDHASKEYDKEVDRAKKRETTQPKAPRPDGLISLQSICAELKLDPKEARVILRKSKTEKPAHGRWEWPEKEVASIKKIIKSK